MWKKKKELWTWLVVQSKLGANDINMIYPCTKIFSLLQQSWWKLWEVSYNHTAIKVTFWCTCSHRKITFTL